MSAQGEEQGVLNHSYLYCMDTELGWGNRSYFTFFSQLNRGANSPLWASLESAMLILLFILSTVANVLIFYTLSSNRRLRTVTNYFVCNLTLADVCFTLCCPLVAVVRVTGTWVLGSFACKTIVYLSCVCGFVTIWTLTLISLDRYSCIVRSSKHRLSPTVALSLIALVWVVTLVAFTPLLLYFVVKECPYGTGVVSICTLGWPRTPGLSVPVLFTSIFCGVGFIVPILILIISHVCIFIKVHKVRAAMKKQRQRHISTSSVLLAPTFIHNTSPPFVHPPFPQPAGSREEGEAGGGPRIILPGLLSKTSRLKSWTSSCFSPTTTTTNANTHTTNTNTSAAATATAIIPASSTSTLDARKRRSSRDLQVVKTLVFLVLLFLAMWAPIFVVFVLIMRDAYYDIMQVSSQAFLGAMCVAYLNAVINPLAYGLSTDRLRLYLHTWIHTCSPASCCCCCASPSDLKLSHRMREGGAGGGGCSTGGGGGDGEGMRGRPGGRGGAGIMVLKSSGGTSVS